MEVRSVSPAILSGASRAQGASAVPAVSPRTAEVGANQERRSAPSDALTRKVLEAAGLQPTEINKYSVKLDIDNGTGRVVALIHERQSGELVSQVPTESVLRQSALLKEVLGTILDQPV